MTPEERPFAKRHTVSIGSAAACLFLFFLPWVNVSCNGRPVASESGFDAVLGNVTTDPVLAERQRKLDAAKAKYDQAHPGPKTTPPAAAATWPEQSVREVREHAGGRNLLFIVYFLLIGASLLVSLAAYVSRTRQAAILLPPVVASAVQRTPRVWAIVPSTLSALAGCLLLAVLLAGTPVIASLRAAEDKLIKEVEEKGDLMAASMTWMMDVHAQYTLWFWLSFWLTWLPLAVLLTPHAWPLIAQLRGRPVADGDRVAVPPHGRDGAGTEPVQPAG